MGYPSGGGRHGLADISCLSRTFKVEYGYAICAPARKTPGRRREEAGSIQRREGNRGGREGEKPSECNRFGNSPHNFPHSRGKPRQIHRRGNADKLSGINGGRGIRTPGTVPRTAVFKTAGFNRSPIPPKSSLLLQGREFQGLK